MQHKEVGFCVGRIFGGSVCVALTETRDPAIFFFFCEFILPTVDAGMCVEKN